MRRYGVRKKKRIGPYVSCMITDGRYSGATRGPCIGHVCPEAYDGGPISIVMMKTKSK